MVVPLIRRAESHFAGGGARTLFRRSWVPEAPESLLVLVHGFAEHSGRYDELGSFLAAAGCAVHALDLQGHGRSDGPRGHVRHFDDFLDDLDIFLGICRTAHPGLPVFVLGHSMGGLVVARWATTRSPRVDGVILSGAAFEPAPMPPAWQVGLLRLLRRLLPRVRMPRPIAPEALSRDPEVGRAYQADPLVFQFMTLSLAAGIFEAGVPALCGAADVELPCLVLHGEDDPLVLASGSRRFFVGLGSPGSDLHVYPGLRHEIFNEPERQQVFAEVRDWIAKRMGARTCPTD